jgi:tRNA (guanine37-N1)-methyltransferase
MKISVITLFPEMFTSVFNESIIKRAIDKNLLEIEFINLRDFGIGKHKLVDDTPYGGGAGMVLRVDVLHDAIKFARKDKEEGKVVLLSAHGEKFNQRKAEEYSSLSHLTLVAGHYEGFDERVKNYVDEEVSIGDFILTGGEIPAMLIIDSVSRLVEGVIKEESRKFESFSPILEHPHYTKPIDYDGNAVPEILLSGNHKKISEWRKEQSLRVTRKKRSDLLEGTNS